MARINGTANDDTLIGTDAADIVNGLGGKDLIEGGEGADVIHGNEGDDRLEGDAGDDILHGDAGNDFLRSYWFYGQSEDGYDQLFGGEGDDSILANYSRAYLVDGGAGFDGWRGDFSWMDTPIAFDAGLAASNTGWSLGEDIIVRGIEKSDVYLTDGDDTFINHTAGTAAYINLGSGADTAFVSEGRNALTDSIGFDDDGTDRLVVDFSGAAAGLRSAIEDWRTLGYASSYHTLWEGADIETSTRTVSTFGFDLLEITGSRFADQIIGNDGRDLISGGGGNDELTALLGNDVLDGGAGSDTLELDLRPFANDGPGASFRYLLSGAKIDLASSEAQALPVQLFYDYWVGGATERLHGRVTLRSIENASGTGLADELYGSSAANRLIGRQGSDLLSGRSGNDRLLGSGGDDTIVGGAGDDTLDGGVGLDTVSYRGSTGRVTVDFGATGAQDTGGGGLDSLSGFENAVGGAGDDRLVGSAAANLLDGGAGADAMVGMAGDDTYVADRSTDRAVESSAAGGTDTVRSSADFTLGAHVENLRLAGFASVDGTGNVGANEITGNRATNLLRGEGGNDALAGAGGGDSLFGGLGRDALAGGAGSDRFGFDATLGGNNVDEIADFRRADDTILLDREVFAGIASDGALDESAFALGTAAGDADDRILYDRGTGRIFYDADGAGGAAAVLFARVAEGVSLTSGDFVAYI